MKVEDMPLEVTVNFTILVNGKSEPKFKLGDRVSATAIVNPDYNVSSGFICDVSWKESYPDNSPAGWAYTLGQVTPGSAATTHVYHEDNVRLWEPEETMKLITHSNQLEVGRHYWKRSGVSGDVALLPCTGGTSNKYISGIRFELIDKDTLVIGPAPKEVLPDFSQYVPKPKPVIQIKTGKLYEVLERLCGNQLKILSERHNQYTIFVPKCDVAVAETIVEHLRYLGELCEVKCISDLLKIYTYDGNTGSFYKRESV